MPWFMWLTKLMERWKNWAGDHEMEIAIRRHLSNRGYRGGVAELKSVKLIAIQRPGWIQIYRFEAVATPQPADAEPAGSSQSVLSSVLLYGLVRDDGRTHSEVEVFVHPGRRIELFQQWSKGMITLRGAFTRS